MKSLIQCRNVCKSFASKQALHDVEFEIMEGKPIALVGPNGAGKTTLFSILCGFISATSGEVSVLGKKPGDIMLSGNLSALPQDAQLDPRFAISHQLRFYAKLQGIPSTKTLSETERVLSLVNLKEVINEKPGALSHGMRKRVSIAQALIGTPKLILLDEPTAGLDPENARNVRRLVQELSTEITFIISSHNLHELEKLCDQVLYLEQGHLTQQNQNNVVEGTSDFITLTLKEYDKANIEKSFSTITGFESLQLIQADEYIIQYNNNLNPYFDQNLLTLMTENNWQYRQIIKGKTLEEQLFSHMN